MQSVLQGLSSHCAELLTHDIRASKRQHNPKTIPAGLACAEASQVWLAEGLAAGPAKCLSLDLTGPYTPTADAAPLEFWAVKATGRVDAYVGIVMY